MIPIILICILVPIVIALSVSLLTSKKKESRLQIRLAQEREVDEINRRRASAEGFYDNVLEADITHDELVGENSKELINRLSLPENATYSQCINAIVDLLVKPQYQEMYHHYFDRDRILNKYETKEKTFTFEFEERGDLSSYRWTRVSVCIYFSQTDNAVKIISYVKNIQAEKEKEIRLMREANTDYLTGIYNMRAAAQLAYELLNESQENENDKSTHALIIADIDHFKQVNDTVGHASGDKILTMVARTLYNNMSQDDIVARIGGDEFMIIMRNTTIESATEKAQKLTELVTQLDTSEFKSITLSLSVGVALYPNHSDNYADLFNKADEALYHAKQNGRNTSCMYGV